MKHAFAISGMRGQGRQAWVGAAMACALVGACPAHAGDVELVTGQPLDFGTLLLFGTGTKTINPDGTTSASGVATISGTREGPAEFTLTYRPGNQTRNAIVQITLTQSVSATVLGTTGRVSNLTTDLSGAGQISNGQSVIYTFRSCAPPSCSQTFRIGGKLSLTGSGTDARFSFPVPVTARLVAEF